jgi:hypothetical protein
MNVQELLWVNPNTSTTSKLASFLSSSTILRNNAVSSHTSKCPTLEKLMPKYQSSFQSSSFDKMAGISLGDKLKWKAYELMDKLRGRKTLTEKVKDTSDKLLGKASGLLWSRKPFLTSLKSHPVKAIENKTSETFQKSVQKVKKFNRLSPLTKLATGAAAGVTAEAIYSSLDNFHMIMTGDFKKYVRTVLYDSMIGAGIGVSLASFFIISPTFGAAISGTLIMMPSLYTLLKDGCWSKKFLNRFVLSFIGFSIGGTIWMLDLGPILAAAVGSLSTYFLKQLTSY